MFLPSRSVDQEKQAQREAFSRIESYCLRLLPNDEVLRKACTVSTQEVKCGDPQCSPIDTMITLIFESGGQGILGLPMEAKEVTSEHLMEIFPPAEILEKWYRGEDADWPPAESEPEPVELRFVPGQQVLCRVGPTDWAPGTVTELWYREPNWQPDIYAPYKIRLADGRDIFAPRDIDQVIRLNPKYETTLPAWRQRWGDGEAAEKL